MLEDTSIYEIHHVGYYKVIASKQKYLREKYFKLLKTAVRLLIPS